MGRNDVVNLDDSGLVVNTDTGEVYDPEQKPAREPAWFKGIKKGFRQLARMRLSAAEWAVLADLIGRLKYGNKVVVNQSQMSADLGLSRQSINQALKTLADYKIVEQFSSAGRIHTYKVNGAYCWLGPKTKTGD